MQPHQLTAVLVALAALGQQDQLLLDELASKSSAAAGLRTVPEKEQRPWLCGLLFICLRWQNVVTWRAEFYSFCQTAM